MKRRIDIPQNVQNLREEVQEIEEIIEDIDELTEEISPVWEKIKTLFVKIVYGIKNGIVSTIKFFKNLFKKHE
jgi:hypothetical protein